MELVRDVVSAMEDEMMDTFEFSASQPVSAAFNVAMPSTPSDRNLSEEDDDEDEEDEETKVIGSSNNSNQDLAVAGPSNTKKNKKRRYPLKEDHFLRQYAIEAEQAQALSSASEAQVDDMTDNVLRSDSQRLSMSSKYNDNETSTTAAQPKKEQHLQHSQQGKKAWEEKFPIMETMSQGAINEMVDKTFKSIQTEREGYINFEEFKECVQTDSSIVSWFEALGTVF